MFKLDFFCVRLSMLRDLKNSNKHFIEQISLLLVDVGVAYIRKLAFLGDGDHIVTANYNTVYCSYL